MQASDYDPRMSEDEKTDLGSMMKDIDWRLQKNKNGKGSPPKLLPDTKYHTDNEGPHWRLPAPDRRNQTITDYEDPINPNSKDNWKSKDGIKPQSIKWDQSTSPDNRNWTQDMATSMENKNPKWDSSTSPTNKKDEATSPDRFREREKRLDPKYQDSSTSPQNSHTRIPTKDPYEEYKQPMSNYGDDYRTDLDT